MLILSVQAVIVLPLAVGLLHACYTTTGVHRSLRDVHCVMFCYQHNFSQNKIETN